MFSVVISYEPYRPSCVPGDVQAFKPFSSNVSSLEMLFIIYTLGETSFLYNKSTCTTSLGISVCIKSFKVNPFKVLTIPLLKASVG